MFANNVRPIFRTLFFFALMSALPALHAELRSWKNKDGKDIQAKYISHDETNVLFEFKGKEMTYPLANLSQADIAWLEEQESSASDSETKEDATKTGLLEDVPISEKLFETEKEFFSEKVRKRSLEEFENGAFGEQREGTPRENWFTRDLAKDTCEIYIPSSYDGTTPYGLLVYIEPVDRGKISPRIQDFLDEFKMIGVSADGAGNKIPMLRRVMLSMDALATVEKSYKIDPTNRIVTGSSGGGHMAMLTAALFPEYFRGAISQVAQSYLPIETYGHFPGTTMKDFKRGDRKEMMWVVISGDKDFNYEEILKTSKQWEEEKLNYLFIDVPGLAHKDAPPEAFKQAYEWIVAGREE